MLNNNNKKDYASWTSAANIVTLMTVTKAVTEASIKWGYSISRSKRCFVRNAEMAYFVPGFRLS